MTTLPKISIVLPTYNGARYLRGAIESCLHQTYRNIELIVVDDCSTDETPEIIRAYADMDPRVKHIRNRRNLRLPRSLNVGFAAAAGEYLTWTSDDNEYLPTALEEMLRFLREHPDVDFVGADMIVEDSRRDWRMIQSCVPWMLRTENMVGACYLYSRRVWEAIGLFNPRFEWVEDYDYWLRVEKRFAMRRLAKVLYLYRDRPDSLTSRLYWTIAFLAYLLRFHHGYWTFKGLRQVGREFISTASALNKTSLETLRSVLQRVLWMNLSAKLAFGFVIWCACRGKVGRILWAIQQKVLGFFRQGGPLRGRLADLPASKSSKTQVLCIFPSLTLGGSERVMQNIVLGLKPRGYDFHLVTFLQDKNPWVKQLVDPFASFTGTPEIPNADDYADQLIQLVRRRNIALLLLTNAHVAYKALAKVKAALPDLKIVDILHLEYVGGTRKHCSVMGAPYIDRRVCISHWLADYMKRQYEAWGIPAALVDRIRVIHNGTDPISFSPSQVVSGVFRRQHRIPQEARVISFIGRMAKEKNPLLFVDIARRILADHPTALLRFVMAGYGPLLKAIQSEVKHHGLEDRFVFPGAVTNVAELLRDSFLLLCPSSHEGIPLAIQEAMLMNVPVISTQVGAIAEIIHDGENGFLILLDEHVVENAVARVQFLLKHEQVYQAMAHRARQDACTEFALDTMCRRYEEVFKEVLSLSRGEASCNGSDGTVQDLVCLNQSN